MNTDETNVITPVSQADLPRYKDMTALFQAVQKDLEAQPLGMLEKLKIFAKNIGGRIIDRLHGIQTPSEYDTGRVYVPNFHGEEYRTTHVRKGEAISETTTRITIHRHNQGLQKNEIKSTKPLTQNGLSKVLSRHSFMSLEGEKDQVLTEGATLPNGVSYARTQNFETGETVFRKNDKGLFWTWTFDRNNRLISSYEGRFGEPDKPDIMRQTDYRYNAKGQLISATEMKNIITPDEEKSVLINHPIGTKGQRTSSRVAERE